MTICEHCGILMSDREARYFPGRGYPVKWLDAIEKVCLECETILIGGTRQQIDARLAKHTRKAMEMLGVEVDPSDELFAEGDRQLSEEYERQ